MSKKPKLYNFQVEGTNRAVQALVSDQVETVGGTYRRGHCFLLHDEMVGFNTNSTNVSYSSQGLGKTIQAFETLIQLIGKNHTGNLPTLIVVPSACIDIWSKNEYYSADFDMRIFLKEGVATSTMLKTSNRTIIVTSFDTLRNAYKYYISAQMDHGGLSNDELIRYCRVHGKSIERTKFLREDDLRRELLDISRKIAQKVGKNHLVCPAFMKQRWGLAIFDEVHKTRNVASNTTKAIGFIDAQYRLALSGTPMMNNGSELLTIWKYALNLFDLDWVKISNDPDGEYCKRVIETISMGRKKANIAELADILPVRKKENEETMIAWTDDAQKALYISVKNDSIHILCEVESMKKRPDESPQDFQRRRLSMQQNFMSKMQTLRQICLCKELPYLMKNGIFPHPTHWLPWNTAIHRGSFSKWSRDQIFALLLGLRRESLLTYRAMRTMLIKHFMVAESHMIQPSPKMIYVYRQLQRLGPTDKMIIFATFKVFLEQIMAPWLDQIGYQSLLFCGGSRPKQRRVLEEFKSEASIKILLIVKSAGSEGLNLQFDANRCIVMEPHFNEAMDEQAAQRIDRIGQEKEVIVRKLYMEGSIDEALRLMQNDKQTSINAWHGGDGTRSMQTHGLFLSKRDTVQ